MSLLAACAFATQGVAYVQVEVPIEQLPQEHEYQKTIRNFLATLTEKDFEVEGKPIAVVPTNDPDELYRMWLLSLHMHTVTAARLPSASFTLRSVESGKSLVLPCDPSECQMLAWLSAWKYPGNPYRGSRAVQLRAFVLAATDMMMLDYLYAHDPRGAARADFLGGNLIWIGYTFSAVQESLPVPVRAAFAAGLKRLVQTIHRWGPTGAMTDMDLFAPVGLRYIAEAMGDPEVTKIVDDYARVLFTDERYFNHAGYFVDNGCFDTSYNGISLYFGLWAALMSDWKFAHDAMTQAYRLRAHLCFPDPTGGGFSGPSAMASRCSGDPPHDQWNFPPKTYGSGMLTDEALYLGPLPSPDKLPAAYASVIGQFNAQLEKPREAKPGPWKESHWSGALNYAYEFYPKGYYERRLKLAQENSPWLKPLYQREGQFVREFGKAFVIARLGGYAAAIHTGPVGGIHGGWQRPYGFGGGELSAFWTPSTGAVLLGRRRGIQGRVYDSFSEWRLWPVHAVTGVTPDGDVVTSSRIRQPTIEAHVGDSQADVKVTGVIPKYVAAKKGCVDTGLQYQRRFLLNAKGVRVITSIRSSDKETLVELFETIPVFLRETSDQKPSTIQFQVGKNWTEATSNPTSDVRAVKIDRFNGTVLITFTRPVLAQLSPEVWTDGFQTAAQCRTVLVDLLESKPGPVKHAEVDYTVSALVSKSSP